MNCAVDWDDIGTVRKQQMSSHCDVADMLIPLHAWVPFSRAKGWKRLLIPVI